MSCSRFKNEFLLRRLRIIRISLKIDFLNMSLQNEILLRIRKIDLIKIIKRILVKRVSKMS